MRVRGEGGGTQGAGVLPGAGVGRAHGELAQQGQLALADDALGLLGHRAEDAAVAALLVDDGAVGEGEIGFLDIAVALHEQEQGFVVGPLVAGECLLGTRADHVPDLVPDIGRVLAQGVGMLGAQHGDIGVVVEIDQAAAPPGKHGLARGQDDANGGLEALRPGGGEAQLVVRPVKGAHTAGHLAVTREDAF